MSSYISSFMQFACQELFLSLVTGYGGVLAECFGNFPRDEKHYFMQSDMYTSWNWIHARLEWNKHQNSEKLKIPVWMEVTIFDQLSTCQLSWMAAITRNHNNECYHSQTQQTYNKKPNTTKVGSIFSFNMLLAILDSSHCQKSQKWLPLVAEST